MEGIIGKKLGMTHFFQPNGRVEPVTVIEVGPCRVTQVKTQERDGYAAVQLGFGIAKRLTKAESGHLKELGSYRVLREFRLDDGATPKGYAPAPPPSPEDGEDPSESAVPVVEPTDGPVGPGGYKRGQVIRADFFTVGDRVDVSGKSKGKGFQGGIRRHGFKRQPKTHGASDRTRAPGSVGAGTSPGRVLKNTRMAGHMGSDVILQRNLTVVRVDVEKNVVMVRGAVPGPLNGIVLVKRARFQRK